MRPDSFLLKPISLFTTGSHGLDIAPPERPQLLGLLVSTSGYAQGTVAQETQK